MIYAFFLFVFVQKSFFTKNLFLFAEINLTTRGPLYTCLVLMVYKFSKKAMAAAVVAAAAVTAAKYSMI